MVVYWCDIPNILRVTTIVAVATRYQAKCRHVSTSYIAILLESIFLCMSYSCEFNIFNK